MQDDVGILIGRLGLGVDGAKAVERLVHEWRNKDTRPREDVMSEAPPTPYWASGVMPFVRNIEVKYGLPPAFRKALFAILDRYREEDEEEPLTLGGQAVSLEAVLADVSRHTMDSIGAIDVIAAEEGLGHDFKAALNELVEAWQDPQRRFDSVSMYETTRTVEQQIVLLATEHTLPRPSLRMAVLELIERFKSNARPSIGSLRPTLDRTVDSPAIPKVTKRGGRLTERFTDTGLLGLGGMGEVRRVQDRSLSRSVALKAIRTEYADNKQVVDRFIAEAQATGQLQHPGIVPVYDIGRLPDARIYYTMREIEGRELSRIIDELHDCRADDRFQPTPNGWTLRRIVDVLHKVSEAVAYAHSRGVIHRDLKPDNIMVGDYGEVLVVDWGLARVTGRAEVRGTEVTITTKGKTQHGHIAGTPGYMPPEQARGAIDDQGPWSDVYALGAILYEVLKGLPPHDHGIEDEPEDIVARLLGGPPEPLPEHPDIPEILKQITNKALERKTTGRYENGQALADELNAYLEGTKRRERALALLKQAKEKSTNCVRLRQRADAVRKAAATFLDAASTQEFMADRTQATNTQTQAARLEHGAEVLDVVVTQLASAALAQSPDLPEANELLADHYQRVHAIAEARGDDMAAERYRILLQAHDRGQYSRYLKGDGALTLLSDPDGAQVHIERIEVKEGRTTAKPWGDFVTPIRDLPLPMGSYRCTITAAGRLPVTYPIRIDREAHWTGIAPGHSEPTPVYLPQPGEISDEEVYVPAGWFTFGDHDKPDALPLGRCWIDAFVIRKFPVTHIDWLAFLNHLIRLGRHDEARRHTPRTPPAFGVAGRRIYGVDETGLLGLPQNLLPDTPVVLIEWEGVTSFASWLSIEEGRVWRLPHELEWEKAARGVDGRRFPWGEVMDPGFCLTRDAPWVQPARVAAFSRDVSPYGVRGMAGNVRDWCRNVFTPRSPVASGSKLVVDARLDGPGHRAVRGGGWDSAEDESRCSRRQCLLPHERRADLGFRLVRSLKGR